MRRPMVHLGAAQAAELDRFRGRPAVINPWATWCPPCRRGMPVLARAAQAHKDVNFLFVNQAETPEAVQHFLSESGLTLDHDWRVARHFGAAALPTTLFLDAEAGWPPRTSEKCPKPASRTICVRSTRQEVA